ncbi:Na+/H+ antiporter NhaA [Leeia sp.]|uniref:Na+/H+ antiporter NhaA n=1 Tax=Leeia sp. TaxID=2884678 RepID=UPI0035B3C1EC
MTVDTRHTILRFIVAPIERFTALSAASGIVLMLATGAALLWVNLGGEHAYHALWELPAGLSLAGLGLQLPLHAWINDGLMAVFFLLVGLEIKRELLVGELASLRQAALPVVGAIGGMLVPAALYLYFNPHPPAANGWGVPMATDIAFALGVLTLLGNRVPPSLRVFLAALAITDDLGAVLVIALFYSGALQWDMLLAAGGVWVVLLLGNRLGVRSLWFYLLPGVALWYLVLQSGVHATVAGVLLAFAIPARPQVAPGLFLKDAQRLLNDLAQRDPNRLSLLLTDQEAQNIVHGLEAGCEAIQAPLQRLEHGLHGVVAFLIMPLFAFANAGIHLDASLLTTLQQPLALGIVAGLVLGKPFGILLLCGLARLLRLARLPEGARWRDLFGVGLLAGMGFTMSIFIASLAYPLPEQLEQAKGAILLASVLAGVLATLWFAVLGRRAG